MLTQRTFIILGGLALAGLAMSFSGTSSAAAGWIARFVKAFGINPVQANSVRAIVEAFGKYGDGDPRKLAYILSLAYHESRLKPIKEIRAKDGSDVYYIQNKYWGTGYYGRGFVQITWRDNYAKFSKMVGVDLVANPDAALQTNIAARIIVVGMMQGLFTGKKLSDYINDKGADYYHARKTVGAITVAGDDTAARIVNHLRKIAA